MKKLIFLLSISTFLLSCKEMKPKVPQFIISGRIENLNEKRISLTQNDEVYELILNEKGEFSDTIYDFENGYFKLTAGSEYTDLYLKDGFDIFVHIDVNEFDESVKYEGIGSSENNFLAKQILFFETVDYWEFCTFPEDTFLYKIDSFIGSKNALLNEYVALVPEFDKEFASLEKKNNLYQAAFIKEKYKPTHIFFNKLDTFELSSSFFDYRKNVPLEDKKALNLYYYPNYVEAYIANKAENIDTTEFALKLLRTINREIQDNELKKEFIYRSAKENLPNVKKIDEYWALISYMVTDKSEFKELEKLYKKVKKLQPGSDSPKANFKDLDGKEASLNDFKGKYIYIDCWAQWCAPCKREAPFLKTLEEKYASKDIVFLKLSLDNDQDAWKKYVIENNVKSNSFIVEKDFDSEFAKAYLINSIPRFILLDKDLKIVDSNAARPSDEALVKLLDSIL